MYSDFASAQIQDSMLQPRLAVLRHDVGVAVVGLGCVGSGNSRRTVCVMVVVEMAGGGGGGGGGRGGGVGALRKNEMNPCLNNCYFISILD